MPMVKTINYKKRLEEIARVSLGVLSDEEVLHLLAERKQLQELEEQYEKLQEEQEMLAQIETEKMEIRGEIDRLNKLITAEKPDDELIHLIEERKIWEAKMIALEEGNGDVSIEKAAPEEGSAVEELTQKQGNDVIIAPVTAASQNEQSLSNEVPAQMEARETSTGTEGIIDRDFGGEKVGDVEFDEASEFYPYLEQIRGSSGSIGRILEGLPANAKRDKLFMLAVAKIDPSYAMHYADQNTLKRDPDFNIKVAAMRNTKGSGSALSEMLPEARTPQVVMAAIKADYRNVRFLLPQMEGYDDMLARAKNGALQKVKELKDGASLSLLLPKILQKDKEFMKQIEAIVPRSDR